MMNSAQTWMSGWCYGLCSDYLGDSWSDWRSEIISFSCSTSIDKKTASIGSSKGVTVHEEACALALFMSLSNAILSSPRKALLNTDNSITISSSSIRKLGTVLPILPSKFLQSGLPEMVSDFLKNFLHMLSWRIFWSIRYLCCILPLLIAQCTSEDCGS